MAIVFVHGVNTRDSDSDYQQAVGARRVLFDKLSGSVLPKDRFGSFATVDDVYWGDLGVQFAWKLQSIPKTQTLQSLGADEAPVAGNPDLLFTIMQTGPAQGRGEPHPISRIGRRIAGQGRGQQPGSTRARHSGSGSRPLRSTHHILIAG